MSSVLLAAKKKKRLSGKTFGKLEDIPYLHSVVKIVRRLHKAAEAVCLFCCNS